jgi:capsular polysaccharide biosynthesis protein
MPIGMSELFAAMIAPASLQKGPVHEGKASLELELSGSTEIPGLKEHVHLGEQKVLKFEKFEVFPAASPGCIPRKFSKSHECLPRFSTFQLPAVTLNGFRLFGAGGKYFNDVSLVSDDAKRTSSLFKTKIEGGYAEDIDVSALTAKVKNPVFLVRERGILLPCSDEPSNFGSWIYRILPKIILAAEHSDFSAIMLYHHSWMTDLIGMLGLPCEVISHNPRLQYHVSRPVIPSLPAPTVFMRTEIVTALLRLHEKQDASTTLGERVYVSRRQQALHKPTFRALENETGLVAALRDLGFVEFVPERYSFAQQLSIWDRSKIIVGCGGSNMFGVIFARHAEIILDLESCDEWSYAHANLLSSTKAQWSMVKGNQVQRGNVPHLNWTIDIDTVVEGIRKLLERC